MRVPTSVFIKLRLNRATKNNAAGFPSAVGEQEKIGQMC